MYCFVIDEDRRPLFPCSPVRARKLLDNGKAAVFKMYPFTIILKNNNNVVCEGGLHLKIDPGSKFTGIAILQGCNVVWGTEIEHRGYTIKSDLESRRGVRRGRRQRNTRYRPARFLNRTRPKGWLPPSLMSRVYNIMTWVNRIRRVCPIDKISMELVKFDTQKMVNSEITGFEYQQGELAGYEVREYLLEKWNRKCAYCGKKDIPLQVEHIVPKARGGSNRVSNLTLACEKCNQKKGTMTAEEFGHKEIQKKANLPLKDAAVMNATRWRLYNELQTMGIPIDVGSGALTKYNRTVAHLPKAHWIDAACVGRSTPTALKCLIEKPLLIKAKGHGNRQICQTNKYGFPIKHRGREKASFGFITGDTVSVNVTANLKTKGKYISRIAGIMRGKPSFCLSRGKNWWVNIKYLRKIQAADGYEYSYSVV